MPGESNNILDCWYAAYTRSRHEKKVALYLREQEVETFLPLYNSSRRWRNRVTQSIDIPLFPGYVFVRIERGKQSKVLSVPGVIHLVGSTSHPVPISDHEMDALKVGCSHSSIMPHPFLSVGARVLVSRGPLAGIEGVLVKNSHGSRLVLSMALLLRSVAVEVDLCDVQPLEDPCYRSLPI